MFTLRRRVLTPLLALSIALIAVPSASAAWGDQDPTFAGTGLTSTATAGNPYGMLTDSVIQPDGKILLAGEGGPDFFDRTGMLQRRLPNGTPDPDFGSDGTVLLTSPSGLAGTEIEAIALQSDGKIVAVASKGLDTRIIRLTSTGQLDTSFAAPTGYISFANERVSGVFVAASGDIFVGGSSTTEDVILRRFTSVGGQIAAFQSNVDASLNSTTFYGNENVLVLPSGSGLLLVTTADDGTKPVFFAARFDQLGNIDTTWGTNGKQTVAFSVGATARSAVVQANGALVIGGTTEMMTMETWTLARLTSGGTLDTTFLGGGKTELNLGVDTYGNLSDIAASPDGGLAAVGSIQTGSADSNGAVIAMAADGVPLSGFGPGGLRSFALGGDTSFSAVSVQPDNKIVAAGSNYAAPAERYPLVARLQNYVAPPPPAPVLSAKVTSPKGRSIAAKKLKRLSGTAGNATGTVTKVEIALQRIDKKLLKKSQRCLWLSSNKAKFKKVKASKSKKCSTPKWLKASGTTKWSFAMKRKLPKGSYMLQVRVTGGGATKVFASAKKFRVK